MGRRDRRHAICNVSITSWHVIITSQRSSFNDQGVLAKGQGLKKTWGYFDENENTWLQLEPLCAVAYSEKAIWKYNWKLQKSGDTGSHKRDTSDEQLEIFCNRTPSERAWKEGRSEVGETNCTHGRTGFPLSGAAEQEEIKNQVVLWSDESRKKHEW